MAVGVGVGTVWVVVSSPDRVLFDSARRGWIPIMTMHTEQTTNSLIKRFKLKNPPITKSCIYRMRKYIHLGALFMQSQKKKKNEFFSLHRETGGG